MLHVEITLGPPVGKGDMTKPCTDPHASALSIRESPNSSRTPARRLISLSTRFINVVGRAVPGGKRYVGQRFFNAVFNGIMLTDIVPWFSGIFCAAT